MKYFVMILTAMFAGARLAGVITWSWWLVFAPLIAYYGLCAVILIVAWIGYFIYLVIKQLKHD